MKDCTAKNVKLKKHFHV